MIYNLNMLQKIKDYLRLPFNVISKALKSLFHIPLYTKRQDKLFKQSQRGDLLFCLMPLSEWQLLKVPREHRIRPYFIVAKDRNYLYGYYCTSHPNSRLKRHQKCRLYSPYGNSRTYVIIKETVKIKREHLKRFFFHLDIDGQIIINRLICVTQHQTKNKLIPLDIKTPLHVGDIVLLNGNFYFIFNIKAGIYRCHPLYRDGNHPHVYPINTHTAFKYIDVETIKEFKNLEIKNLYSYLIGNEMQKIFRLKKQLKSPN